MTTRDEWLALRGWAEQYEDAQKARIAATNRAERGGADPDIFSTFIEGLEAAEHTAKLALAKQYRKVVPPAVREWEKTTLGIGQHLIARLIGHLGHPVMATPYRWEGTGKDRVLVADEPYERTLHQLWQYCGHGAPGRRTRGMSVEDAMWLGNPKLKMLVHLQAESCMKTMSSPYRLIYDTARENAEGKVHATECVRCGPSGKPAQPGTPWSKGHQHAHALRIVGKEILRDLWTVAGGGHIANDAHVIVASSGDTPIIYRVDVHASVE